MASILSCNWIGRCDLGEAGGGVGLGVKTVSTNKGLADSHGGGEAGGEGEGVGLGVGTMVTVEASLLAGGV